MMSFSMWQKLTAMRMDIVVFSKRGALSATVAINASPAQARPVPCHVALFDGFSGDRGWEDSRATVAEVDLA
ncbi:hypothetical protein ACU8OQ_33270 (plasmid) [Rhizobium leguminosarum]|jgi:hypothetical protein